MTGPAVTGPAVTGPGPVTVRWVGNHDDARSTVRYLAQVGDRGTEPRSASVGYRPVVLRPTPGGGDQTSVALDLLIAAGKNPDVLRTEQLRGETAWRTARAWLTANEVTHLVIDRAHDMPVERLLDLTQLGRQLSAQVWMIWSHWDDSAETVMVQAILAAGAKVDRLLPEAMTRALPRPGRQVGSGGGPQWPRLPVADFTTFRAACRRQLGRAEFDRVDQAYRDAADRTDAWLDEHAIPQGPGVVTLDRFAVDLVGWLRDVHLGPVADPRAALIVLRGTQAALFGNGILLRWIPDALGPDPASRLPGTLTPIAAGAIDATGRTEHAAATALSLHLNQSPNHLTCIRLRDVADDGSAIAAHQHEPVHLHHGWVLAGRDSWREISCESGIILPEHAQPALRAHLTYRRLTDAAADDPLFANPDDTAMAAVPQVLRNAAIRTCDRLNLTPNWLHRNPCKYGADIGLNGRAQGWLIERGLHLHQLDPALAARSPRWRDRWMADSWTIRRPTG